ncbi:thioredoxin [Pelagibacteraceae bacterium]|nr:thioredoxin [Pelagibacteraceae bacterium]
MNEASNIIDINEAEFNEKVVEASNDKLVVVDFWAPWCGPCKQLTPILEKIIGNSKGKITLVKINIDDNQQIASQLRIQSIPTVYAFKDKEIVNAFQGVLSEKQVTEFLEKSLGKKITENFDEFYSEIKNFMSEKKFEETKDLLLEFITNNPGEIKAINFYLECLLELKQFDEVDSFIESLEKSLQEKDEIKKIIKKMGIIKNNLSGPDIEELILKLNEKPDDIDLIIDISEKYFSIQKYESGLDLLLENYLKNKEKVKNKMIEFFEVLGNSNEYTIRYRKKLSQIMFS